MHSSHITYLRVRFELLHDSCINTQIKITLEFYNVHTTGLLNQLWVLNNFGLIRRVDLEG